MTEIYNYINNGTGISWLDNVIEIALIIILVRLLTLFVKFIFKREAFQDSLYHRLLKNIIIVLIYLVGLITIVGQIPSLSKYVDTIIAGSGIIALAVSLSAQESLSNILSGLFITIFKPFEIGDRVRLVSSDITGIIEDITLRHTVIRTFTNTRLVVPNSTMSKETIENSNLIDNRASAFVDVVIAYESDLHKAMKIISDIIGNNPLYLDIRTPEEIEQNQPKVEVYLRELGRDGVHLRASMWTKSVALNFKACSDARIKIKEAFDNEGIEIPYNKISITKLEET